MDGSGAKALKSGIWYVIANFITKGIIFISTPVFARMLSKEEYGLYSNYTSWLSVCTIVITMNLAATFISAKFDYKEKFDSYISSIAFLSLTFSVIWIVLVNVFDLQITALTGIKIEHLNIMLIYMMFTAFIDLFQTREKFQYEYKKSVLVSLVVSLGGVLLSIVLVYILPNKLDGRIIGGSLVNIIVGALLFLYIVGKGKSLNVLHWKYALPICLPYIPHLLSLTLLNSVDRIMITKICGPEDNALYTIAYSCGAIVTVLITSMNTAFSPWLGEKLNDKKYDSIRKFSKVYVYFFCFLACGVMLIAPEVLLLMGGKPYLSAIYVMPPVAFGLVCQFMYTMFVNIEQFMKKTLWMAIASVAAAALNYFLNYLFIPRFGYIAAAYTTLVGFVFLLFSHMIIVKKIGLLHVYDTVSIIKAFVALACFTVITNLLIGNVVIRYVALVVYIIVLVIVMKRYYKKILGLLKNKNSI